jgi:hypothetical protein
MQNRNSRLQAKTKRPEMLRKRLSKKGDENTIRFLIGVILGITIIFSFARCAVGVLKGSDASLETFKALSSRIEQLGNTTSSETEISTQLIHIEPTESWMFFDAGVNYTAVIYTDISFDEFKSTNYDLFGISGQQYDFDYFLKRAREIGGAPGVYLYSKPAVCGDSACAVLCNKPMITRKEQFTFRFYDQGESIGVNKQVGVIECESYEIRAFTNIQTFYRKPSFIVPSIYKAVTSASKAPSSSLGYTLAFIHGFVLETRPISKPDKIDAKINLFSSSVEAYRFLVYEFREENPVSSKLEDSLLISGNDYLSLQPYKDIIVACYQPPCLTSVEESYLLWNNNLLNPCLDSGDKCSGLQDRINSLRKLSTEQKLTFTLTTLPVASGQQGPPSPGLKLTVENTDENSKTTSKEYWFSRGFSMCFIVSGEDKCSDISEASFYTKTCNSDGKKYVIMKTNAQEYVFNKVYSSQPPDLAVKPNLEFYVAALPANC